VPASPRPNTRGESANKRSLPNSRVSDHFFFTKSRCLVTLSQLATNKLCTRVRPRMFPLGADHRSDKSKFLDQRIALGLPLAVTCLRACGPCRCAKVCAKPRGGVIGFKLQPTHDTNIAVPHPLPSPRGLWRELLLGELPDNARAIGLARSAKQPQFDVIAAPSLRT
jgi:hypothetical protein